MYMSTGLPGMCMWKKIKGEGYNKKTYTAIGGGTGTKSKGKKRKTTYCTEEVIN